jgi:hypothetical protein
MAEDLKGAKEAGSPPAKNGANDPGSPPAEELIAENKRKAEELKEAKAELSSMQERLAELEEKERTRELSAKEEREKADLKDDVKTEAQKLRQLKETQPWIEVARQEAKTESEKTAFDVMLNNELERANDFIDDKADELGITPKELANKLRPYAMKFQDKRPSRRNEMAYREWQKDESKLKSLSEREKALKDKEDNETKFREGAGRYVRDKSFDQELENADSKGDKLRLMRKLVPTHTEA